LVKFKELFVEELLLNARFHGVLDHFIVRGGHLLDGLTNLAVRFVEEQFLARANIRNPVEHLLVLDLVTLRENV